MSIEDLDIAFSLIRKYLSWQECGFSTSKSLALIAKAEENLGINFPNTYKLFIQKVGNGGLGDVFIPGIYEEKEDKLTNSGVVWGVLEDRKTLGFPKHLVKLYEVGEGTTYCLDTSQMNEEGECPVVAWPLGGYEETPVLEVIAEDFGKFFLDMVEKQIAYKKEAAS
jgi:hypothetical protein